MKPLSLPVLLACVMSAACTVTTTPTTDAGAVDGAVVPPADAGPDVVGPSVDAGSDAPAQRPPYVLKTQDELCDGVAGLTGASLIGALKAEYNATFSPRTGSASALSIKLKYDAGEIKCHPAFNPGPGVGAPSMPAWIEVTVAMGFDTVDGLFAEQRNAQVSRRFGDTLELSSTLPLADVKGTFKALDMPGFDLISVGIGGSLKADTTTTGTIQQYGAKSAAPPPGQVNPGVTQNVGTWK
jgi:hypothetical protein